MQMWLVLLGAGALLLRVGFAWQASGGQRSKNAAGAVLRTVADTAIGALAFWAVGAALLLQTSHSVLGIDRELFFGQSRDRAYTSFFHLAIFLTGGAIVGGALAERARFYVGVIAAAVLAAIVLPIAGHWVWFGWLKDRGFVDVAGATVIHLSSAVCAAVGILFVGSRTGKYNKDGSSNSIPGHALPLIGVGTLMLVVAWFPYLLGCVWAHVHVIETAGDSVVGPSAVLGTAAMNLLLSVSAAALAGMTFGHFRYGKPDLFFTFSGLLGGLVAISAGAASIGNVGAVFTGAIAGVIVPFLTLEFDMRWHLDDPLGVVTVHGIGGLWGTIAAALFAPAEWSERLRMLGVQLLGAAAVVALSAIVAVGLFFLIKTTLGLRVSAPDEFDGLDLGEHDINAYPDFQQTTIKSYHLREA